MTDPNEFYETYGQQLATRLAVRLDRPLTFVYVEDVDNPEEITGYVTKASTPENVPVLVWDNFEEDIDSGGRDNYHLVLRSTFSVLQKGKDPSAKKLAYKNGRNAVLKALAIMLEDAQDGVLIDNDIQVEVRQFPLQKVGPFAAQWYGYGLQFSWLVPIDLSLESD